MGEDVENPDTKGGRLQGNPLCGLASFSGPGVEPGSGNCKSNPDLDGRSGIPPGLNRAP